MARRTGTPDSLRDTRSPEKNQAFNDSLLKIVFLRGDGVLENPRKPALFGVVTAE
jgi:hypothetical protein